MNTLSASDKKRVGEKIGKFPRDPETTAQRAELLLLLLLLLLLPYEREREKIQESFNMCAHVYTRPDISTSIGDFQVF